MQLLNKAFSSYLSLFAAGSCLEHDTSALICHITISIFLALDISYRYDKNEKY